jgi:signal transduction histidine kinase
VKHIAQLHGGTVEAESEPGRGTTVRVHLPVGVTQS